MTRRNKLDYFPFFPKDCETDESIRLMDDAQLGFWVRLMCYQWPNGSVPSDPDILRRGAFGTAPGGVARSAKYISDMLSGPVGQRMKAHPTLPERLADPRMLKEREIAEALCTRRRSAGNKGASARHGLANASNKDAIATGNVQRNDAPVTCDSHVIPSVSVSVSNSKTSSSKWEEFGRLYPAHRFDEDLACQMWLSRADDNRILEGLKLHLACPDWREQGGKWIPKASRFISDGAYKIVPLIEGASEPASDPYVRVK